MKKINKSRYAILGMLFDEPRSGYEILQFMRASTTYFWQESDASLYPMLKTLEQENMVIVHREFQGKRERRLFEITQAGRDAFLSWLAKPAQNGPQRNEFLLKLFFGAALEPQEVIAKLGERLNVVKQERKAYKHVETELLSKVAETNQNKAFWNIALQYGMMQSAAEQRWLEESLALL